jgi:hypothetical protein
MMIETPKVTKRIIAISEKADILFILQKYTSTVDRIVFLRKFIKIGENRQNVV